MKPGNKPSRDDDHEAVIHDLRQELDARIAEADWLKARYEAELRAALVSRPAAPRATIVPVPETVSEKAADAEKKLQTELDRALAAEARYLDRIDELKDQVDRLVKGGQAS